jgi:hypothetical protein
MEALQGQYAKAIDSTPKRRWSRWYLLANDLEYVTLSRVPKWLFAGRSRLCTVDLEVAEVVGDTGPRPLGIERVRIH